MQHFTRCNRQGQRLTTTPYESVDIEADGRIIVSRKLSKTNAQQ